MIKHFLNSDDCSVREAAESLNLVLMELIEDLDDRPTPAVRTPSVESGAGEVIGDGAREGGPSKEEVPTKVQAPNDPFSDA